MSSYKRIPKSLVNKLDESISIAENYQGKTSQYIEYVKNDEIGKLKEKIKEKENEILQEVEQKREDYIQQAYQEGFEKAKKEVEQEIIEKHQELLNEAHRIYEQANLYHKTLIEQTEVIKKEYLSQQKQEIMALVMACAEKVVHQEVEHNHEKFELMFQKTLESIQYENKKVYVRMNPQSIEWYMTNKNGNILPRVELLPDSTLGKLDIVIETEREYIDAKVSTQLQEIEQLLRSVHFE